MATRYGTGKYSIGICDRCHLQRPYQELRPDRDTPGLLVCGHGCNDQRDPYKLPARQPDPVALKHPRPDRPIAFSRPYLMTEEGQGPYILMGPDGVYLGY